MEEQGKDSVVSEKEEETLTEQEETTDNSSDNENDEEINQITYEELQKENETLLSKVEQLNDRMLRIQAEFENYKRRTEKERIAERKYKSQDLANELLPVLDNFERALQTETVDENKGFVEGIEMVYNQLISALKSEEIEPIETENKPFDPNFHHAVMQVEDDEYEPNTVVEELQKGYMLKDKVIRPAMVKVNK